MVQFRNRTFASLVAVIIVAAASLWVGCSDRDDRPAPEDPDPAFQQAAGALDRAQDAMQKAGVDINFSDIGALGNLATILPDPLELGVLEDEIQEAIGAFYEVLDAVGQQIAVAQAPALPVQAEPEISDSDLALVHIHLAYLYVLEAVRILTIEGWGNDGVPNTADDLFFISFPEDPELEDLDEVYQFELTELGQARFDAIENTPGNQPEDFLKEFSASQRQAVLDAALLLSGARVKVSAFPDTLDIDGQPIFEQTPQVAEIRRTCRQDAVFHLQDGLDLATAIAPDFADAMVEFSEILAEAFAEDFLDQVSEWGFEIENEQEVLDRIDRLIGN